MQKKSEELFMTGIIDAQTIQVLEICFIILLFIILLINFNKIAKPFRMRNICKNYNISIPFRNFKKYEIYKYRNKESNIYFQLAFPSWKYANKNGTRDARRANNVVLWKNSYLYISNYCITCKSPVGIIQLVNKLRQSENEVDLCKEEQRKYQFILKEKEKEKSRSKNIDLYTQYRKTPYEFEEYVAKLYQYMGYKAHTTSRSNDGGYDIVTEKNGVTSIIECKCYAPENKIGRPLIQKLVGANQIAHASHMVFCTTSEFTKEAIQYAYEANVEIIDGHKLFSLTMAYIPKAEYTAQIYDKDWQLNVKDLKQYYPQDLAEKYF